MGLAVLKAFLMGKERYAVQLFVDFVQSRKQKACTLLMACDTVYTARTTTAAAVGMLSSIIVAGVCCWCCLQYRMRARTPRSNGCKNPGKAVIRGGGGENSCQAWP